MYMSITPFRTRDMDFKIASGRERLSCLPRIEKKVTTENNQKLSLTAIASMWITDELGQLRVFVLSNIRRLIRLLSLSGYHLCAEVTESVKEFYKLLFASSFCRMRKAVVAFNRWLIEVLDDEHCAKGIESGQGSSLVSQNNDAQDQLLVELFDNDSIINVLRTVCNHYMFRCESLQQSAMALEAQVENLKSQLQDAVARAFEVRLMVERDKELSALQNQHVVSRQHIADHLQDQLSVPVDALSKRACQVNGKHSDQNELEVGADFRDDSEYSTEGSAHGKEEIMPTFGSEDDDAPALNVFLPSEVCLETDISTPLDEVDVIADPAGFDYQQLTQLKANRVRGGWYRHALRALKKGRKQHRHLRKSQCSTISEPTFGTREFEQLVSIRDMVEYDEDSTWYHKALQHLKRDRKSRDSLRDHAKTLSTTSYAD